MIENSRAEGKFGDPEAQLLSIIQEMVIELWPKRAQANNP